MNTGDFSFEFCKLEIFVPESHLGAIRQALALTDAGHVGTYDLCLSYSHVTGSWRPLEGSSPYDGKTGKISESPELKIEVLCKTENVRKTVAAIKAAHPYEVPVINVIPLIGTGI